MKKLLLSFLIALSLTAGAQRVNDCGFIIPRNSIRSEFASVYEARGYINNILNQVNWEQNFQVKEQNGINNAYATIINNQRYIVYDNRFLENLDNYAGTKWASISVLAHEVGHHYYNHMFNESENSLSKELEADYFSGFVMEKLGASLQEATAAMNQIASERASSTHPGKTDRLNAITNGWNKAYGSSTQGPARIPSPSRSSSPSSYPSQQQQTTADDSWIQLSLYGNSDMTVYLSDDGRKFTAAPVKTSEPFVFKFDVYDYGWLRFGNGRNGRTYKLYHGRDYAILWNRRTSNWTVIEVS
jgi:hypothetical protein